MFQNIISGSEHKYTSYIRTFEKTQTKSERWKENDRRETNYFIGKYATSKVRFFIVFVNIL